MAANFQECLRLVKEAHPDLYPIWWIEDKGQLLFCMLKRGVPQEEAAVNFYAVDGKNVSGSIPVMSIYDNDALAEKLKQSNMIDPEDRKADEKNTVVHSAGWGIRKNTSCLRIKSVRRGVGFEAEEAPLHDSRDDFLCHYGIKGQKWGIRRYQNEDGTLTQLGKEHYAIGKVEKKAAKDFDEGAKSGKYTNDPEIKELFIMEQVDNFQNKTDATKIGKKGIDRQKLVESNRSIMEDSKRIFQEKTEGKDPGFFEKRAIKKASFGEALLNAQEKATPNDMINREITKKSDPTSKVVKDIAFTVLSPTNVVFLATDGVKAAAAKVKETKYLKNREANSEMDPETGFYKKKDGEYDEKSDLAAVNPRFMDLNSNSKNNCMLCTTTYDLRQRGYDVTAQMDSIGYTFGDLKRWYPNAEMKRNSRFDESGRVMRQNEYVQKTIKSLLDQGDGARGNLMAYFPMGGGHSVVYEVKNGQLLIKDGQANKVYKNPEKFLNLTSVNSFARLDNIEPDMKRIKAECCR